MVSCYNHADYIEACIRSITEQTAKQLGVEDCVLMPGSLENAFRILPGMNFFVLPSLTEGLPISLLEAIAARLPVVATRVGGVPEVLPLNSLQQNRLNCCSMAR